MDIDIDGVLSVGNLQLKWSDIKEAIHSFPDILAEEEYMNLQSSRLNSAVFREFQQPSDELSLFVTQLGSLTELQRQQRRDFLEAPANTSSGEYLQWLETAELSIVEAMRQRSLRNATSLVQASGVMLKLAHDLDLLRPHNDSPLPHHVIKLELWRVYWHALIAEMRTVEVLCSADIRNSGVFVLTTWPYKEFLRLLAGRLLAEAISVIHENE